MNNNVKLVEDESVLSLITGGSLMRITQPPLRHVTAPPTIRQGVITILHGIEEILESLGGLLSGLGKKGAGIPPAV